MREVFTHIEFRNKEDLETFVDSITDNNEVTFNALIEQPDTIARTFSPSYEYETGFYLFRDGRNNSQVREEIKELEKNSPFKLKIDTSDFGLNKIRRKCRKLKSTQREVIQAYTQDIQNLNYSCIEEYGKAILNNLLQYAVIDWHSWGNKYWGTPLDILKFLSNEDELRICMVTEDFSPSEVIKKITKDYGLIVYVMYADGEVNNLATEYIADKGKVRDIVHYNPGTREFVNVVLQNFNKKQDIMKVKDNRIVIGEGRRIKLKETETHKKYEQDIRILPDS